MLASLFKTQISISFPVHLFVLTPPAGTSHFAHHVFGFGIINAAFWFV
jgi:hypothetical protein